MPEKILELILNDYNEQDWEDNSETMKAGDEVFSCLEKFTNNKQFLEAESKVNTFGCCQRRSGFIDGLNYAIQNLGIGGAKA